MALPIWVFTFLIPSHFHLVPPIYTTTVVTTGTCLHILHSASLAGLKAVASKKVRSCGGSTAYYWVDSAHAMHVQTSIVACVVEVPLRDDFSVAHVYEATS